MTGGDEFPSASNGKYPRLLKFVGPEGREKAKLSGVTLFDLCTWAVCALQPLHVYVPVSLILSHVLQQSSSHRLFELFRFFASFSRSMPYLSDFLSRKGFIAAHGTYS